MPSTITPEPHQTALATELVRRDLQHLDCTGHAGSFGRQATRWRILTAVTALLPYPRAAKQTRLPATSAPLHSVMPSTITPEPHQTALATELGAICSAWGALEHTGSFGSKQHVGVLTTVTALVLQQPNAAKQTRPSATSAPLHSVMPSTITPEPHHTALATELAAICSDSGALKHAGSFGSKQHVGVLLPR